MHGKLINYKAILLFLKLFSKITKQSGNLNLKNETIIPVNVVRKGSEMHTNWEGRNNTVHRWHDHLCIKTERWKNHQKISRTNDQLQQGYRIYAYYFQNQ